MEEFNETLFSSGINTNYLNLDTLYEFCGTDLIEFFNVAKSLSGIETLQMLEKYKNNLVVLSLFRGCAYHMSGPPQMLG